VEGHPETWASVAVLAIGSMARKGAVVGLLATLRKNGNWKGLIQVLVTEDGAPCLKYIAEKDEFGIQIVVIDDRLRMSPLASTPVEGHDRALTMSRKYWKTRLPEIAKAGWALHRPANALRAVVYIDSDILVGQSIHTWLNQAANAKACRLSDMCGFA